MGHETDASVRGQAGSGVCGLVARGRAFCARRTAHGCLQDLRACGALGVDGWVVLGAARGAALQQQRSRGSGGWVEERCWLAEEQACSSKIAEFRTRGNAAGHYGRVLKAGQGRCHAVSQSTAAGPDGMRPRLPGFLAVDPLLPSRDPSLASMMAAGLNPGGMPEQQAALLPAAAPAGTGHVRGGARRVLGVCGATGGSRHAAPPAAASPCSSSSSAASRLNI